MNYFILEVDDRSGVELNFNLLKENLENDDIQFVYTHIKNEHMMTDYFKNSVLFTRYHFVSYELMKLFMLWDENMKFTPIFITDKEKRIQKSYWKIDKFEKEYKIYKDIHQFKNHTFDINQLLNSTITKVTYGKNECIVINQMVAESILRRLPIGIKFTKININQEVSYGFNKI